MNNVTLIGNAATKPELNNKSETPLTSFTIAVNRRGKEGADFFRCFAVGRNAENIAQYVNKGRKIGVKGRLQTSTYERDGVRINSVEIFVEECEFLGPNPEPRSEDKSYHNYGDYSEPPRDYRRFEEPLF